MMDFLIYTMAFIGAACTLLAGLVIYLYSTYK